MHESVSDTRREQSYLESQQTTGSTLNFRWLSNFLDWSLVAIDACCAFSFEQDMGHHPIERGKQTQPEC
jgi:hypothetical protein